MYGRISFLFRIIILSFMMIYSYGQQQGPVIGIDLGTTYSCVAVYQFGRVEIIHNDQGNRITPSYVAFTSDGERLIGDPAINQLTKNPENTIFDAKRFIGRTFDDPVVQNDNDGFPFKLINKDNKPFVEIQYGSNMVGKFSAEEISGMVLSKMKRTAEEYLGKKVSHAVITVPAYFHDAQRQATRDAAAIAGLEVLRIINEPTAAAIAYGSDRILQDKIILVYDLGGGTFDVTLFKIIAEKVHVLQTSGDLHLGGQDFNRRVLDYFIKLFKRKTGKDISRNNKATQRLRLDIEKAKRVISYVYQSRIEVDYLFDGVEFSEVLTRAKFEELNKDLFSKTLIPVQKVLSDTNTDVSEVDEVVLVGGSTRIPKIQQLLKEFFKGKELSKSIHPDEAVAHGAAIQAAVLTGQYGDRDKLIIDVVPHSIGIDIGIDDRFVKCIKAGTPIPVEETHDFTTLHDQQRVVLFAIFEGENELAKDNRYIGEFILTDIQIAKAGVPIFQVKFRIDEDGILTVTAHDKVTSSAATITVKYNEHRISQEELTKLITNEQKMIDMDNTFLDHQRRNEL